MKTVIMESLGISDHHLSLLEAPFAAKGIQFEHYQRTNDIQEKIRQAKDADVLIIANMPLEAEVIKACDHLKFIDVAFTGVNHIALEAAEGIPVSNAAGYSTEAVAELGVGMVLSVYRYLRETEASLRRGGTMAGLTGTEIRGKTVGIVGYGKIGKRSGELFHAFGAKILANKRRRTDDIPEYVELCDLDTLLCESDIVLLHVPLNESTKGMIGEEQIARMKKNALLVNLARGPVVDQPALIKALENGRIAGACLDVFETEPPLVNDPVTSAVNTLLTPHIGFATKEALEERAEIVFQNLGMWLEGKQSNVVR